MTTNKFHQMMNAQGLSKSSPLSVSSFCSDRSQRRRRGAPHKRKSLLCWPSRNALQYKEAPALLDESFCASISAPQKSVKGIPAIWLGSKAKISDGH